MRKRGFLLLILLLFPLVTTSAAAETEPKIIEFGTYYTLPKRRLGYLGGFSDEFMINMSEEELEDFYKEATEMMEKTGYYDITDTVLHLIGSEYPGESDRYPREETTRQLSFSAPKPGEVTARFEDQRMLLRELLLEDNQYPEDVKEIIDRIPDEYFARYYKVTLEYYFNTRMNKYDYATIDEWTVSRALVDFPELEAEESSAYLSEVLGNYKYHQYEMSAHEDYGEYDYVGMKEHMAQAGTTEEEFYGHSQDEIKDAYYKAWLDDNAFENFSYYLGEVDYE